MNVKQAITFPALCMGLLLSGQVLAESVIHVGPGGSAIFYPSHDSGSKTAQQVQQELDAFKRNPVSADGVYRYVGGDQGWVVVPHEYVYRDGKWVHVDKLPHDTPAPLPMTQEERKQRDAMYPPG